MTLIIDSEPPGGLIRSDSKGRVLVPAAQREALLDAFEASGQSGTAFCRQHGLKYPTFATWVQKRRGDRPAREEFPGEERHPAFVEVVSTAPVEASGALAITLADGTRVDVTCRGQLPWVAELLRHLNSSRPC